MESAAISMFQHNGRVIVLTTDGRVLRSICSLDALAETDKLAFDVIGQVPDVGYEDEAEDEAEDQVEDLDRQPNGTESGA